MKTNRDGVVLVFFAILFFFGGVQLADCSSSHEYKLTPADNWIVHADGSIITWDAERLQKVVPFKIIFPKYLPKELNGYPPELTKMTGANSVTELIIVYQSSIGSGEVWIEENDSVTEWAPNKLAKYTYLDIAGVKVLEQQDYDYVQQSGQQVKVSKLEYTWNRDKLSFSVIVTEYDQAEARKIVESMIK